MLTAAALPRAPAQAAAWPTRSMKLIVNFPPSTSPDVAGRSVATPLSQALGRR